MNKVLMKLSFAIAAVALAACDKPSPERCKLAIVNIQTLMGTDKAHSDFDLDREVRRCRSGSRKESVECAINAKSVADLQKCEGWQDNKGSAAPAAPK
jgi:hypothetical protein